MQSLQQLQQQFNDDPSDPARYRSASSATCASSIPFTFSNDPLLNERIQAAVAGVEQVEMELRRKVDDRPAATCAARAARRFRTATATRRGILPQTEQDEQE